MTEHENLEIIKFVVTLGDGTVNEVPVKGSDDIHFIIPADTDYQTTIHFRVKKSKIVKLVYKQEMKKFGIVVKRADHYVGDEFEPREEEYVVAFKQDHSPQGIISRGTFWCNSKYFADEEELFESPWRLTIS